MIPKLVLLACLTSIALPGCGGGASMRPELVTNVITDDTMITARVKTSLLNDTQVAATKIDVSAANGVVTMSGTVKSKADETRAIELARQTEGVKDVISTLEISPTPRA
jgi:osmotically-inducible protein OsmY